MFCGKWISCRIYWERNRDACWQGRDSKGTETDATVDGPKVVVFDPLKVFWLEMEMIYVDRWLWQSLEGLSHWQRSSLAVQKVQVFLVFWLDTRLYLQVTTSCTAWNTCIMKWSALQLMKCDGWADRESDWDAAFTVLCHTPVSKGNKSRNPHNVCWSDTQELPIYRPPSFTFSPISWDHLVTTWDQSSGLWLIWGRSPIAARVILNWQSFCCQLRVKSPHWNRTIAEAAEAVSLDCLFLRFHPGQWHLLHMQRNSQPHTPREVLSCLNTWL